MVPNSHRRNFLQSSTAVLTAGATVGLSGCIGAFLGIDDDSQSAIATLGRWVPARDVMSGLFETSPDGYGATYLDLVAVVNADERVEGNLLRGATFGFDERFGVFDLAPGDVAFRLYNSFWDVLRWEHDPETLASILQDAGFEQEGNRRNVMIFGSGPADQTSGDEGDPARDGGRLFAFDGTYLVHTRRSQWQNGKAITGLERLFETKTGEIDRFADENDTVTGLLDAAYGGDSLSISRLDPLPASRAMPEYGLFEGVTGRCLSGRFETKRFRRQDLYQFHDGEAMDMDAIQKYVDALEDEDDGVGHATETTVNRQGRLVEVTYALTLASMAD